MSLFHHYLQRGGERLRCGYTTGTCATLGAKACGEMLLSRQPVQQSTVRTPKGIWVTVDLEDVTLQDSHAVCTVMKDGGDDVDITHGMPVVTEVMLLSEEGIQIRGGIGVGTVTKKGLNQPVGEVAINSRPREMITSALTEISCKYQYTGGFLVTISLPWGERLAPQTFNPRLGIVNGLSILGTSGIVEPKSVPALLGSIEAELSMHQHQGETRLILTLGEYGSRFLSEWDGFPPIPQVQISNFIGDTLDMVQRMAFSQVLVVGHIGKLVKLSAGIMNTHSRYGDGRREVFTAYAALCGGDKALIQALMSATTSEASLDLLEEANLLEEVMDAILQAAQEHLSRRVGKDCDIAVLMFRQQKQWHQSSPQGQELLQKWGVFNGKKECNQWKKTED